MLFNRVTPWIIKNLQFFAAFQKKQSGVKITGFIIFRVHFAFKMTANDFGNPLRKFKLVFLGEQSVGKTSLITR